MKNQLSCVTYISNYRHPN